MNRKQGLFTILVVLFATITVVSGFSADVVAGATINVDITVSAVAAVTVSGAAVSFTVGAVAPTAGEFPAVVATATPTYLQYSSVVANAATRTIAVQANVAPPPGLILSVRAGTPTGHGGVGVAVAGGVTMDSTYVVTTDQNIITGITSCATGSGVAQGPAVYYDLSIDEATFTGLDTDLVTTIVLTYTLIEL